MRRVVANKGRRGVCGEQRVREGAVRRVLAARRGGGAAEQLCARAVGNEEVCRTARGPLHRKRMGKGASFTHTTHFFLSFFPSSLFLFKKKETEGE